MKCRHCGFPIVPNDGLCNYSINKWVHVSVTNNHVVSCAAVDHYTTDFHLRAEPDPKSHNFITLYEKLFS